MQLILCDSCRRVVDPADLDGGRGARMGEKAYCADCVPGGPGRPQDVSSCRACQVSVVHAATRHGDEPEFATHALCVRCEKNPARTPLTPHTVKCAGCATEVTLRDLRVGVALPLGEQAWCATCRVRVEQGVAPASAAPAATPAAAPPPTAAAPAPAPAPEPAPRPRRDPAALACDACSRDIDPTELRTGVALVVNGRLVCPRCRGRSARQAAQRRASTRYAANLVLVLVIFPVASATLAILIYRAIVKPEATPVATAPPVEPAVTPAPETPAGPAAAAPDQNAELRALFADFLKAVTATERARATAPAPGAAPGSALPTVPAAEGPRVGGGPPLVPAPDERPEPGPGAAIAKQLESDAARRASTAFASADPGERLDAVLELATLTAEEAAPILRRALEDPDAFVRVAAAKVAGKLEAGALLDPLVQRLSDPERSVRRSVAQALGRITKTEQFYLFEDLTDEQLAALRRAIDKRRGGAGS